eukprot:TRINITY_DN3885_c0_g1_i4.p1 TRINITY_DN3885_c0_g1~~TRINITY_DN3885_c0_g1_i4.p1  ORF type:complete len:369 (+),score=62.52 TRINITY_DN3885_c0_g1_i4:355-1461(+)
MNILGLGRRSDIDNKNKNEAVLETNKWYTNFQSFIPVVKVNPLDVDCSQCHNVTIRTTTTLAAIKKTHRPYFEIRINSISNNKSMLAIGLVPKDIKFINNMPGWDVGSYGYHTDDETVQASGQDLVGEKMGEVAGIKKGDVIGCGVDTDSIYWTRNGIIIERVEIENPNLQSLYPAVALDYGIFSSNFGDFPFVHNIQRAYDKPAEKGPYLNDIPDHNLTQILSYLLPNTLDNTVQVNKKFKGLSCNDELWKIATQNRWPLLQVSFSISNWRKFYKRRANAAKKSKRKLIDNCEQWEFKCPLSIDLLERTDDPNIDYCSVCQKEVHLVTDIEELDKKSKAGLCVIADLDKKEKSLRRPRVVMMGRRAF